MSSGKRGKGEEDRKVVWGLIVRYAHVWGLVLGYRKIDDFLFLEIDCN